MEIVTDLKALKASKPVVVALGNFDGVHKGHQQLIGETIRMTKDGGSSVVMVFEPHPRMVLNNDSPKLLTAVERKAEILEGMGLDYLLLTPFNREIASWTPEFFVDKILVETLGASRVYVGYNYSFGRGAQGDAQLLTELGQQKGFEVEVIAPVKVDGQIVSSTLVRKCLEEGDVEAVNKYTGRWPRLQGRVQHGEGRGLGFPTANLDLNPQLAQPDRGVYAARALVDGDYYDAVVNIGFKPTFHEEYRILAEAHILDFAKVLYDQEITVLLVKRLRDERKFPDSESLVAQIKMDIQETRLVLNELKKTQIVP
ncbi:MAG: bifunctional riboflavin kinase/FAD synthetase [Syntrophomonadaceae bacterium]|nr:bifunctional riboflavin kinase/FAD synthetase [Syntrophomonadaceae bacterium]